MSICASIALMLHAAIAASPAHSTAAPPPPAATSEDESVSTLVTTQLQPLIDGQLIPGAAVGVWRDGATHFFGLGGTAADGTGPAPDAHTLYEIGSITKVYTAVLLAEMAEAGSLSLDDPIAAHLPDGRLAPQRGDDPIRLWHLAAHASGLPRMPDNMPAGDPGDPYAAYTLDLMYDFLDGISPARAPEAAYDYSNLGSGLLGRLLQEHAGRPYHELLDERLFDPAGMTESFVLTDADVDARVAVPSSEGLRASRWGGTDALAPCGAIVSSASDQLRFAAACIEPSDPDGTLARALAASRAPRFTDPASGLTVALGWHVAGDGVTVWHNGGTGGFSSMLLVNVPARTAVVVLTNGSAAPETTAAGDTIMRGLLTGTTPPAPTVEAPRDVAAEHLERLVGSYDSPLGFTIHVTREGDRLGAQLTGQPRFRVYPEGDGAAPARFRYRVVPAVLAFDLGEDGPATAVTLEQGGREMRAERQPDDS